MSMYRFTSIELREANEFIIKYHRHNKPVLRGKFQIGMTRNDELIGVGIAGRPVARKLQDDGKTIEIVRVCVKEGCPNASSKLYARMIRICRLLGFEKVITYTLQRESQSSLKAVGGVITGIVNPQSWNRPNRLRTSQPVYTEPKFRWELSNKARGGS